VDPTVSATQLLISLFDPDWSIGFFSRWLLVLLFLGTLYALIAARIYRDIPVTIVSTNIELRYLTPDGARGQVRRTQTLRANQRRVTAFFGVHYVTAPNGRIPRGDIHASAFSDTGALGDTLDIHGSETKSLEVIHMFGRPLPYAWFMPLVPIWLIRGDYDNLFCCFRRFLVQRTASAVYENEFNSERVMYFASANYPSYNIVITLNFEGTAMPAQDQIKALQIKSPGVVTLPCDYRPGEAKAIFRLHKMQNERLRISW
jgi:hypothetical protein